MVDLGAAGGDDTLGVRARRVAGGDEPPHPGRGTARGGADLAEPARVRIGDHVAPLDVRGRQGELASQVGDHGPVAAEVARELVQADQGGDVDPQLHEPGCLVTTIAALAREQVDEQVGAQLVHAAGIAGATQVPSQSGEIRADGRHPVRRQIHTEQVRGPVRVGICLDPAVLHCRLVPLDGGLGLQLEGQAPDASLDLGGGAVGGPTEHGVDEVTGGVRIEMGRLVDQHPGPDGIDAPRRQRFPHGRQPVPQRQSVGVPAGGGRSREAQRSLDLGDGRLVDVVAWHRVGCELGGQCVADRNHRPGLAGGVMSLQASRGSQRDDAVVARQPVDVDGREGSGERRSRWQVGEPRWQ